MKRKRNRLTKITALHYYKLIFRSLLFIVALVFYIIGKIKYSGMPFEQIGEKTVLLVVIGIIFIIEMIFRFFPSSLESMGCQKQFARNYIPTESTEVREKHRGTLAVLIAWLALNGIIAAFYFIGWIDSGILVLISLFYSVCDMICILFFCPFQTWFMKNKCCGSCRIYNWDYAMMFTPLAFIPHPFTWGVFGIAMLLLLYWEIMIKLHPERFCESTNAALSCANCKEKLCHHKSQLRHFLRTNRDKLFLKGNAVIERVRRKK